MFITGRMVNKYGVAKRYKNYRQMIDEIAPDGVYVIGPPHHMYDIWLWCLEQGLNLYIEKPMGLTIHQAQMLAYLAQENDCITQVSFQRRSCPMVCMLRDECLKRGPIVHAICRFYKSQLQPCAEAHDHMMGDCVHSIDTVRWMCGGEVVDVRSECKRVGVPDINFILATIRFDNGATGVVINSWSSGKRIFAVEMHAPGIYAEAEHEGKSYLYADGNLEPRVYDTREVSGGDELYVFGGFQAKNREFIDALKGGPIPSSHFRDAVKTMEVAEMILAQALLSK